MNLIKIKISEDETLITKNFRKKKKLNKNFKNIFFNTQNALKVTKFFYIKFINATSNIIEIIITKML